MLLLAAVVVLAVPLPPSFDERRVQLPPLAKAALVESVAGAHERLARPECDALLDEFKGQDGRVLRASLTATPAERLALVVFADGHGEPDCRRKEVLAFTAPGSRVVFVCGERFVPLAARAPERAEAAVIHELLHTLGLPEDPPSSREITARVMRACVPEAP